MVQEKALCEEISHDVYQHGQRNYPTYDKPPRTRAERDVLELQLFSNGFARKEAGRAGARGLIPDV